MSVPRTMVYDVRVSTPGGDRRTTKRKIIEAVDEEYLGELKKDYVGYSDETEKYLLTHLKTTWRKITKLEKGKDLGVFHAPWDMT